MLAFSKMAIKKKNKYEHFKRNKNKNYLEYFVFKKLAVA